MDKNERKQLKSNFFRSKVRKEGYTRIKEIEKSEQRKLTREEKHLVMKTTAKQVKKDTLRYGATLLLGIGITASGIALLNSNNNEIKENNKKIVIDAEELDKDIEINNVNNYREIFVNGIKVKLEEQDTQEEKIQRELLEEIENLETQEDILNYIKNIYVSEYNGSKGSNYDEYITTENVTFNKTRQLEGLKSCEAQNGDRIFIIDSESKSYVNVSSGIISVTVNKDGGIQKESVASSNGSTYLRVYNANENIKNDEDNLLLEKLGAIVDTGIDYSTAIEQEENSEEINKQYTDRFLNALTEYKVNKIEQFIESDEYTNDEK